jgi:multimeric flavodoxin WrbA
MKVLGLSCGRKMGNSEILVREALMETEQLGAEIEIIRLLDLNIKHCTGCISCTTNKIIKGGGGECIQKNDHMPFLLNKLAESDGVILGAPAFMLMPPGLLTLVMNRTLGAGKTWGERVAQHPKVGAVIAVGGTDWVNMMLP